MFENTRPSTRSPGRSRIFIRELFVRPAAIYALFALLITSNVALGVTLLMSPEIERLLAGNLTQSRLYEQSQDRVLRLRLEVDRLRSREYMQDGELNVRMQDLLQRQQGLSEQYRYIRVLAEKAGELGITTASVQPGEADGKLIAASTASAAGLAPLAPLAAGDLSDLDALTRSLTSMVRDGSAVLSAISEAANASSGDIVEQLQTIGISAQLPADTGLGRGGPFIPAGPETGPQSLAQGVNGAYLALQRFEQARLTLNLAPVRAPLPVMGRISSPFGNRVDPFGNARAFHSGIDYPNPAGTPVFGAGPGTILFAGWKNGYGKFIEIDHGNGLVTRYAHLSAILVETGQQIGAGELIGKVGSSGRSTGPHLHFEVRRDDLALDPAAYLRVGQRLSSFII